MLDKEWEERSLYWGFLLVDLWKCEQFSEQLCLKDYRLKRVIDCRRWRDLGDGEVEIIIGSLSEKECSSLPKGAIIIESQRHF